MRTRGRFDFRFFEGPIFHDTGRRITQINPNTDSTKYRTATDSSAYIIRVLSRQLSQEEKPKDLSDEDVRYEATVSLSKNDHRRHASLLPVIVKDSGISYDDTRLAKLNKASGTIDNLGSNTPAIVNIFSSIDKLLRNSLASDPSPAIQSTEVYLASFYKQIMEAQNNWSLVEGALRLNFTGSNRKMVLNYNPNLQTIKIQDESKQEPAFAINIRDIYSISLDQRESLVAKLNILKHQLTPHKPRETTMD
jgi:hypothetical protein